MPWVSRAHHVLGIPHLQCRLRSTLQARACNTSMQKKAPSGVLSACHTGNHVAPHLLCELGDAEGAVLLAATGGERREAHHEEVQPGKGDKIYCQLAQVSIQLSCRCDAVSVRQHFCMRDAAACCTNCMQFPVKQACRLTIILSLRNASQPFRPPHLGSGGSR